MKTFVFSTLALTLLLFINSCCSQKELTKTTHLSCEGIVHVAENGCPFYIEITSSNVDGIAVGNKIYPVELKDTFKKKGLRINFNATVSRAKSPEGCSIDGVAALSDVVVVP